MAGAMPALAAIQIHAAYVRTRDGAFLAGFRPYFIDSDLYDALAGGDDNAC